MVSFSEEQEIVLTIHGAKGAGDKNRLVSAKVFQDKFSQLLAALRKADRAVNSKEAHDYVVSQLRIGSAEFGLKETRNILRNSAPVSPIASLFQCAEAIYHSNYTVARKFHSLIGGLEKLVKDVDHQFEYLELTHLGEGSIPIDSVFKGQLEQFKRDADEADSSLKYFSGQVIEELDCHFLELDFRGRNSRGIMVLTGSNIELPCAFSRSMGEDEIKGFLKKRIRASCNAIYDGSQALPARIEVANMRIIKDTSRPSDWSGSLWPFDRSDWENNDEGQFKQ